jgi:hypothetical protein
MYANYSFVYAPGICFLWMTKSFSLLCSCSCIMVGHVVQAVGGPGLPTRANERVVVLEDGRGDLGAVAASLKYIELSHRPDEILKF